MRSLLASHFCVCGRGLPSAKVIPQWRRSSIHFWHYVRQKSPHGQTKFLTYSEAAVPDISQQEIRLWSGSKFLGVFPAQKVFDDDLGPGRILCLRTKPVTHKERAPEDYEYEVRELRTAGHMKPKRKTRSGLRAIEFHLNSRASPERLRHVLATAYRYLDPERGLGFHPVEFHLQQDKILRQPSEDLVRYTRNRLDLHPAVMLRAMPEGVYQLVRPQTSDEEGDAVWMFASRTFQMSNKPKDSSGEEQAEIAEKLILQKKELLTTLIRVGDLRPDGKLVGSQVYKPQRQRMRALPLAQKPTGMKNNHQKKEEKDSAD